MKRDMRSELIGKILDEFNALRDDTRDLRDEVLTYAARTDRHLAQLARLLSRTMHHGFRQLDNHERRISALEERH
ncbi:MAG TPA: hypothetical protein VEY30_07485 [Myxococcaceae bacterium]|nr:hypothetical protein [Myxococcaceae bacterium]